MKWLRVREALQVLVGLSAAAGAVTSLLLVTGTLGAARIEPAVDMWREMQLELGTEANITGQNLDLVSEVLISKGLEEPIPLFMLLANKSRLVVAAPSIVTPGHYFLVLKTNRGEIVNGGTVWIVRSR